jgi:hypothetical protein
MLPFERRPINPVPRDYRPPKCISHKVRDGESWETLATRFFTSCPDMIYANFKTNDPAQVNWYLHHYVGCNQHTRDGKQWMFSSSANPGVIYIPTTVTIVGLQLLSESPEDDISGLPLAEKLKIVVEKAIELSPHELEKQLLSLVQPVNLGIMAGVVAMWAVSHFFGAGEIVDVILMLVGYAALGVAALAAARDLFEFGTETYNAKTKADLYEAAEHLVKGIVAISIQVVLFVLLMKAPKAFEDQYFGGPVNIGTPPRSPGSWFSYKPTFRTTSTLPAAEGETSVWGDIEVSSRGSAADQAIARYHELVHQWLTPKLYPLRSVRVQLSVNSYNRSYVLRYLEEALAETIAQLRANGVSPNSLYQGVRFPLRTPQYVTIAGLGTEVGATLLGPINVCGMTLQAFLSVYDGMSGRPQVSMPSLMPLRR